MTVNFYLERRWRWPRVKSQTLGAPSEDQWDQLWILRDLRLGHTLIQPLNSSYQSHRRSSTRLKHGSIKPDRAVVYQIKAFIQSPTTSFTLNTNTSDYNPLLKLSDKSVKSLCSLHQNKITISQLHTVHLKISNKIMDSSIKNICSFNLHSVTHLKQRKNTTK